MKVVLILIIKVGTTLQPIELTGIKTLEICQQIYMDQARLNPDVVGGYCIAEYVK